MKHAPAHPEDVADLRSALLAHYDRSARDLPWRRDDDPYRVLVSEIMLQQTRVETVLGYYGRWLERFPTVEALAEASEDEVMKAWEGLGYYRRARNLHRTARMVRERSPSGSAIPSTSDGLRELPGVGEYTAGAVASIAFGRVVPAVDGNVRRVLARLFDEPDPKPAWLRRRAGALVDPERPGDWNQALMELGATLCTPRSPDCPACPVAGWCGARAAGTQAERPAPSPKREVPSERFALAVLERKGRLLVERRPEHGMLAGLWAFPERRLGDDDGRGGHAAGERGWLEGDRPGDGDRPTTGVEVARELGLTVVEGPRRLEAVRHRFTHLDATYFPEVVEVTGDVHDARASDEASSGSGRSEVADERRTLRWIDPWDDDSTALPAAQRKVLDAWCAATT